MANKYQMSVPVPFIPGSEFAGVVTEIGDGNEVPPQFAVGDRVMGTTMVGAFAEEVVVVPRSLSPIPAGVSDESAAAFGVAHRTAYHALRTIAAAAPGERLVVLGAGGGAARGVNHKRAPLRAALKEALADGSDIVIDPVGGELAEPALRSLRWAGRFVSIGYASGTIPKIPLNRVLLKGCKVLGFQMRDLSAHEPAAVRRDEEELRGLLADGTAMPHVGAVFKLAEAAAALRQVADGKAISKVIVTIG